MKITRVDKTPEEGRRTKWPKRCDSSKKDENILSLSIYLFVSFCLLAYKFESRPEISLCTKYGEPCLLIDMATEDRNRSYVTEWISNADFFTECIRLHIHFES